MGEKMRAKSKCLRDHKDCRYACIGPLADLIDVKTEKIVSKFGSLDLPHCQTKGGTS